MFAQDFAQHLFLMTVNAALVSYRQIFKVEVVLIQDAFHRLTCADQCSKREI